MGSLSNADLTAVLDLTRTAYAFDGLESFRTGLLPELRRLISADSLSYNELDLPTERAIIIFDPVDTALNGVEEAFLATSRQHPGVVRHLRGDRRPGLLSDVLTVREYHRLDLYNEVYKQLETEDQIYFHLTEPAMVTIAINRSRRTFSPRDRELIELLEPHLRQAYVQAQQRERARTIIAAQHAGLEQARAGLVLLDGQTVVHASGTARELLARYYPGRHEVDGILPQPVADWLWAADGDLPHSLVVANQQGRLRLRLLSGCTAQGWRTLLLDEQWTAGPDAQSLRELGLTDRQAEVLRLLAAGHDTQKISELLCLSAATVRKHLENIYARLGVQSRTQAIAVALRGR